MQTLDTVFENNPSVYRDVLFNFVDSNCRRKLVKVLCPENEKLLEQCNSSPTRLLRAKIFIDTLASKTKVCEFIEACEKLNYNTIANDISHNRKLTPNVLVHERYVYGQRLDEYLKENPGLTESLIEQLAIINNETSVWYTMASELSKRSSFFYYITCDWINDIQYNSSSPQGEASLFLAMLGRICSTKEFLAVAKLFICFKE